MYYIVKSKKTGKSYYRKDLPKSMEFKHIKNGTVYQVLERKKICGIIVKKKIEQ